MEQHNSQQTMADEFFPLARASNIDPSVAFILQIPPVMQTGNEAFKKINEFCTSNDISINQAFFKDLTKLVSENGICPITPRDYVISTKKDKTLRMYLEKKDEWGIHIPYFFQTGPGCVFCIFRTSADGLIEVFKILSERNVIYTKPIDGSKKSFPVDSILEHPVLNNPIYALFDLDDYLHRYQGRLNEEEIIQLLIKGFPSRFTSLLIESGCIDEEAVVQVTFKNKSRDIDEMHDKKLSFHEIFSLFSSKTAHKQAVAKSLQLPYNDEVSLYNWLKETKKTVKATKDYSSISIEAYKSEGGFGCLTPFDQAAPPGGSNGITIFYSKKNRVDPYPTYSHISQFCLGMQISIQQCPYPTPHDINSSTLSNQQKLQMLYDMSYTIPKWPMTFYSHEHLCESQDTDGSSGTGAKVINLFQFGLARESNPISIYESQP